MSISILIPHEHGLLNTIKYHRDHNKSLKAQFDYRMDNLGI